VKKFLLLAVFIFILILSGTAEDFSTVYGSISEMFENPDPNTGLTAFPTLLIPLGGKYEGMGTAFTAVADDSSFLEANPSASSLLKYTELSLVHNNWIADSNLEGVIYTVRFNDLGIGFGGKFLYVPFTEYNSWGERVSRGYYSESIATANISYNFFSSYYFYGVSVGANLKAAYRHLPSQFYSGYEGLENQSTAMILGDFGILSRFNLLKFYASRSRNFSIGAVVKNLGPYAMQEPLPTEGTVGLAYSPIRPLTLSVDFNFPFSFKPEEFPAEEWNVASGMDVAFTDFFSVQGGFQIRGSNPRISLGSAIDLEKITLIINSTLDMTTQYSNADHFSVEAKFKLGDRGRAALQSKIDDLYTAGLEEYADGNFERALGYLRKLIELDPRYQPASELIEIITRAVNLQEEMESIQQVEEE